MSVPFHVGGKLMNTLLRLLRSYIDEGYLTINSYSNVRSDFSFSIRGLFWNNADVLKLNQVVLIR